MDITWMIPCARPAPIKTLQNFSSRRPCVLVSDPRYFINHKQWINDNNLSIDVVIGERGLVGQIAFLYKEAYRRGTWCFRTDDDLEKTHYITKDSTKNISLDQVIDACESAAISLKAGIVGLGGMNRFFLNSDQKCYGKAKGVLLGQTQLFRPSEDPFREGILDKRIQVSEDIYRTISHHIIDGVIGRLKGIGMNWNAAMRDSVKEVGENAHVETFRLIENNFPGMVKLNWQTMNGNSCHSHIRWRILR